MSQILCTNILWSQEKALLARVQTCNNVRDTVDSWWSCHVATESPSFSPSLPNPLQIDLTFHSQQWELICLEHQNTHRPPCQVSVPHTFRQSQKRQRHGGKSIEVTQRTDYYDGREWWRVISVLIWTISYTRTQTSNPSNCLIILHNLNLPLLSKHSNTINSIWPHTVNRHQAQFICCYL